MNHKSFNIPIDTSNCVYKYYDPVKFNFILIYETLSQANKAKVGLVRNKVNRIIGPEKIRKQFHITIPIEGEYEINPNNLIPISSEAPRKPTRSNDVLLKHLMTGPEPVWPPAEVTEEMMIAREKRWGKKKNLTPQEREELILIEQGDWDNDLPVEFKLTRHSYPVPDMKAGELPLIDDVKRNNNIPESFRKFLEEMLQ